MICVHIDWIWPGRCHTCTIHIRYGYIQCLHIKGEKPSTVCCVFVGSSGRREKKWGVERQINFWIRNEAEAFSIWLWFALGLPTQYTHSMLRLVCVFTSCSSCFRLISAPISRAPKDIGVLIMEMILAANAQEVAMDRIVIKCHER